MSATPPTDAPTGAVMGAPPHADALRAALQHKLQPTVLDVLDESADHAGHMGANAEGFGTHFRVRIASPLFAGKTRVAKHRLVYDSLGSLAEQGVHALAITARCPEEA